MNQRAVRWLRAELPALVASGIISAENAQAIERYYEARSTGSPKIGFVLLAAVGSILVAAGIVLLIAHNWNEFSRPVLSVIAFLPLLAAQALSVAVLLRRNESKAWRECAAIFNVAPSATLISLVSQTYQIHGSLANFIFVGFSEPPAGLPHAHYARRKSEGQSLLLILIHRSNNGGQCVHERFSLEKHFGLSIVSSDPHSPSLIGRQFRTV